MLRAYRYRLYPTASQAAVIEQHIGAARFVYNWSLALRKRYYRLFNKSVNWVVITNHMVRRLKKRHSWLYDISHMSLIQAIRNMDRAYRNFFRDGRGFPRFKSKHRSRQSYQMINAIRLDGNRIKLHKMKQLVRIRGYRGLEIPKEQIKTVTVSRDRAGHYYVSVLVDNGQELPQPALDPSKTIGIDLGLHDFAILSDGRRIPNPRIRCGQQGRLASLQRVLARKQGSRKGEAKSNNWRRLQYKISQVYWQIGNQKSNFFHNFANQLVESQDYLVCENLNVANMVKNHNIAASIHDTSWSSFLRILEYKATWRGKVAHKVDRFFPSSKTCSACGDKQDLRLSERVWTCGSCGVEHDRDVNAAINIMIEGRRAIPAVSGPSRANVEGGCYAVPR